MKFRYKLAFFVVTGLMTASVAGAQNVRQEDLQRCAMQMTAEVKLACYEALTSAAAVRSPSAPEPATDVPSAAAAVTSPSAPEPATELPSGPVIAPITADAIEPGEPVAADPSPAQSPELDELGKEYLENKSGEPSVITATVVEVTRGRYDVLIFRFASGQVWRQSEARRFSYPKKGEFEVTISTGMMGDYQLRVAGDGPMTRIRRIK